MIERLVGIKLTWIDMLNPTSEEIREVMEEASLPPELVNDLIAPVTRSYAVCVDGVVKVTLDYPIVKRTDINHPHEITLIATKTHLVSVHYEDVEAIHRFKKEFELLSILKNAKSKASGGHLLNTIMLFLYDSLNAKLDFLETRLSDIESDIFKAREKEMVFEISNINRRVITFKHVLATHKKVLEDLGTAVDIAFTKDHQAGVSELKEQFNFLTSRINSIKETVFEFKETNMALLTTKQNELMKTFTILAFITYPLTLFTSTFGMNTESGPIIGHPYDFWIIVAIMLVVSIGFFVYFKYKRWI